MFVIRPALIREKRILRYINIGKISYQLKPKQLIWLLVLETDPWGFPVGLKHCPPQHPPFFPERPVNKALSL
jgi:hypothetical protein